MLQQQRTEGLRRTSIQAYELYSCTLWQIAYAQANTKRLSYSGLETSYHNICLVMQTCRRAVWQSNVEYIQKHNIEAELGLHTYTLGQNEYADLVRTVLINMRF